MYVTSIESSIFKFNLKINPAHYNDFKKFVSDYCKTSEHFFYVYALSSGYAVYCSNNLEFANELPRLFYTSRNEHTENSFYRMTSIQDQIIKYVANFHTKQAAEEFYKFLDFVNHEYFRGPSTLIRNSVVFYCSCPDLGYKIAKNFEEDYANRIIEKVNQDPPASIHPIDDNQKVYDFKETVVETENSKMNKIFSIFKVNSNDSDNKQM